MDPAVVPYRAGWPAEFEAERSRLDDVLGADALRIEHIGSTAIPGMPAKPILDMMVAVADLRVAAEAAARLAPLGYRGFPHRRDAVAYRRRDGEYDTHHLHLTTLDSALWRERLAFRDAVRADDGLAAEYRALKQELVARSGGAGYRGEDKRLFVRRVLTGAGVELADGLHTDGRGVSR